MDPLDAPFESKTFMNFPLCTDLSQLDAQCVILGIPFGNPYPHEEWENDQSHAPTAIRHASARLSMGLDRWDFDLGGLLLADPNFRIVDCGDVPGDPSDPEAHYRSAERIVRAIIARHAIPIVLGGDHGVPIPVLRALETYSPVTLIQVDAHIDWRDEVGGVHEGYSSPIRRASELAHIDRIFQIGIRSQGSARSQEVADALAYGAKIITAYEVHEHGIEAILSQIPTGGCYYLTIDADGLDPSVMPAVAGPAAGGLLFHHVRSLIHGLAAKGKLLGMDIVEITPKRDINEISAITAGQIILNFIRAVQSS